MSNVFHKDFTGNDNHALTARTYADISARDADNAFQVTTNIDKVVRVDNPVAHYFMLVSVSPAKWTETSSETQDEFIELNDTPSSYSSGANKIVQVNSSGDGLEFGQKLRITDSPTFKDINITENIIVGGLVDGVDVATDVGANTTHRTSDGSDHGFINQDVTTTAKPLLSLNTTVCILSVLPSSKNNSRPQLCLQTHCKM